MSSDIERELFGDPGKSRGKSSKGKGKGKKPKQNKSPARGSNQERITSDAEDLESHWIDVEKDTSSRLVYATPRPETKETKKYGKDFFNIVE